ncbi:sulfotransferase family protein [Roseivirga sp.]|uniref:sulfotransferase family protein n=1 Tax=Roseivirga sp. TaxID=1964215 RepID=UPI003B5165F7
MNSKQKLILAGVFRSGTTFLARALNSHPQLNIASDPFFEFFKVARNIWFRDSDPKYDDRQPLEDYFLKGENYYRSFHDNFETIRFESSDIEELKRQIPRNAGIFSPAVLPFLHKIRPGLAFEVFEQLLEIVELAYPKQDASVTGIKEVWVDEFASPLLEQGYKFVHIIRDPRAIIASNKKSSTGAYPILFLIRQWRKSAAFALRNRGRNNFFLIRYEDMVSNPDDYLRSMLTFIGVPFHSNVVNANTYRDGSGKQWTQNTSYQAKEGINTKSMEKWRTVLDTEEISIVEGLCQHEMKALDYEFDQTSFPIREMLNYDLPAETIADWIRKYDFEFNEKRILEEYLYHAQVHDYSPIPITKDQEKLFHI